jgi:hypothetical protein
MIFMRQIAPSGTFLLRTVKRPLVFYAADGKSMPAEILPDRKWDKPVKALRRPLFHIFSKTSFLYTAIRGTKPGRTPANCALQECGRYLFFCLP